MRLLKNIYNFIVHNTIIFVIFVLMLSTTVLSVLFTVNYLSNVIVSQKPNTEEYRTYVFSLGEELSENAPCNSSFYKNICQKFIV